MPGFADKLSDDQAAALVNYLRATWGGQKPDGSGGAGVEADAAMRRLPADGVLRPVQDGPPFRSAP